MALGGSWGNGFPDSAQSGGEDCAASFHNARYLAIPERPTSMSGPTEKMLISEQIAVLRPYDEISQSWYRAKLVGLRRDEDPRTEFTEVDYSSRIARAAAPVLADIENEIADVPLGCLLTDRHGALLQRAFGARQFQAIVDGVGAQVGAIFDEQHTGTNALATPLEARRPVLVERGHHYLHALQRFACDGVPILDPRTRPLEGILDLMAPAGSDTTLMKLVVNRATMDSSRRKVSEHDDPTATSVAVFESMRRRMQNAPVLIAAWLVMQNSQCIEILRQEDYVRLAELHRPDDHVETMELGDRAEVQVRVRAFGRRAALFDVSLKRTHNRIPRGANARVWLSYLISHPVQTAIAGNGHVVVAGEPGTGHTSVGAAIAQAVTQTPEVVVLDLAAGASALKELESTPIANGVVVEGLEIAEDQSVLARLRLFLDSRDGWPRTEPLNALPAVAVFRDLLTSAFGFGLAADPSYIPLTKRWQHCRSSGQLIRLHPTHNTSKLVRKTRSWQ